MKEFKNYCKHGFAYNTYVTGNHKLFPNSKDEMSKEEELLEEETRLIATFNITDTNSTTNIMNNSAISQFSEIEIDGIVQPSVVNNYTFDSTGEHIIKYTIIDSTTIGNGAFQNCTNLTDITIPNTVTTIGFSAFKNCAGLTDITIPSNVIIIRSGAFQNCTGLVNLELSNGITGIGQGTFSNCTGLTSVTIPSTVTSIDLTAFSNCSNLTNITSLATTPPSIQSNTFKDVKSGGTLYVPQGTTVTGYGAWMRTDDFYLGKYGWNIVEL